jgi:hypothetical protein
MKQTGKYIFILIAIIALWDTLIIKPFKLFTVFLHELGHAAMAFIFGYGIKGIRIGFNEGGYALTYSKGKIASFMIYNGGYLGSVLFSLLILSLKKTQVKKYILGTVAIVFLGVSIRYAGFNFTLLYSIIFAVLAIIIYMIQNERVYDWTIDILGISGVAYAIYDTFVDTILIKFRLPFSLWGRRAGGLSDADQLAKLTHIPAIFWGLLWTALSLFAVYMVLIRHGASGSKGSKSKK